MIFVSNHLRFPVYVSVTARLFEILLLSSRPTLRAQDAGTLMNSNEYYSKFVASHQDATKLMELRQDTGFPLFVQAMNSIS
jgi:hypothetical protein